MTELDWEGANRRERAGGERVYKQVFGPIDHKMSKAKRKKLRAAEKAKREEWYREYGRAISKFGSGKSVVKGKRVGSLPATQKQCQRLAELTAPDENLHLTRAQAASVLEVLELLNVDRHRLGAAGRIKDKPSRAKALMATRHDLEQGLIQAYRALSTDRVISQRFRQRIGGILGRSVLFMKAAIDRELARQ